MYHSIHVCRGTSYWTLLCRTCGLDIDQFKWGICHISLTRTVWLEVTDNIWVLYIRTTSLFCGSVSVNNDAILIYVFFHFILYMYELLRHSADTYYNYNVEQIKIGHYLCMHRLTDKRTQWPTLFRQWFCNSEANRHEICTRLRQRVESEVLRISSQCVQFHSMKLTAMFKLNFEKICSSPLNLVV